MRLPQYGGKDRINDEASCTSRDPASCESWTGCLSFLLLCCVDSPIRGCLVVVIMTGDTWAQCSYFTVLKHCPAGLWGMGGDSASLVPQSSFLVVICCILPSSIPLFSPTYAYIKTTLNY